MSKVVPLRLHPAQAQIARHPARFKCVVAGRRFGKSHLCLVRMITEASKGKNRRIWYIAPSFRMAKQIMWRELKNNIPKSWLAKKPNETELTLELRNGTEISCKGADNPDSLRGVGLDYVVLDEYQDMRKEVWEECIRPTLATTGGHALFIGTPKSYNLLYDAYIAGQDPNKPQWMSWQFPTIVSPFIPKHEIEQARRDMDPRTFQQEFEASFLNVSGRVYYPFDRSTHVRDYVKFNPKLPICVGMDFNIDPMSMVVMQEQEDGKIWIVDEIVQFNSNVDDAAEELARRYWRHLDQTTIYPDPAGKARQHARGETSLDVLREHGFKRIKYRRKHPAIDDRVNAVNRKLQAADGTIGIEVAAHCKHVIRSFEQTMYKEGSRDINKKMSVEHVTDALGYYIEREFPIRKISIAGYSI
ncbi:terminase family protein [Vibrio parahaemolyticus]|uniref:terminase large subunit domain-containing protein n=1 Tax=Vibrio harveyi group TaxID=717610 RepID=UPI00111E52E3|nr:MULTISPECIES: terminase family protein [Vibrio harveyi group]ELA7322647.1 terminase family protein [Vibrio parahaemolyticus]MBS9810675.1 terminase family protein [Vibrio alginolyticus]MCF9665165.1 terminase family protein [Vibrio parahaemolyticus]MCQ9070931.1 terminase [Vibrio alginolyticus]MCR9484100.1 terminase family protein [Vibrio alginolyticus]